MNGTDLAVLRPAFLKLATLFVLGAGAAALGWRDAARERVDNERLGAERQALDRRMAAADLDVTDLAGRYRQLEARGLFGVERRLDWIDLIAAVSEARQLFNVGYDFAAQRPLDATSQGVEALASTMKLRMSLLHEGDLVVFLDDLADRAPALLRVQECRLERVSEAQHGAAAAARLAAVCRIDWITLRTPA